MDTTLPPLQPGSPGWYIVSAILLAVGAFLMNVYAAIRKARRDSYEQEKDAFATTRDTLRQGIIDLRDDRDKLRERIGQHELKNEQQSKQIAELRAEVATVRADHRDCERRLKALESQGEGRRRRRKDIS